FARPVNQLGRIVTAQTLADTPERVAFDGGELLNDARRRQMRMVILPGLDHLRGDIGYSWFTVDLGAEPGGKRAQIATVGIDRVRGELAARQALLIVGYGLDNRRESVQLQPGALGSGQHRVGAFLLGPPALGLRPQRWRPYWGKLVRCLHV